MDRWTDGRTHTDGWTDRWADKHFNVWLDKCQVGQMSRLDKCHFLALGWTNVRSDKFQGRTNVLFMYRSDKRHIFSLRSDKCGCILGLDKCRGQTVGPMSVGQTSVGQKLRHYLVGQNNPLKNKCRSYFNVDS